MNSEKQSPQNNTQEKVVDHSGKQGFEFPVEEFRSESTGKIIPLGKAVDNGYTKFPTGEITLTPEADRFITLPSTTDEVSLYSETESQTSDNAIENLDEEEVDEEPVRKSKLKRALFYASTGAALITALVVGGKVMADKNDKTSELDIWNKSSPVATAPLIPTSTPQETTTQPTSNEVLGINSDLTSEDIFDIAADFYPEFGYERIKKAITNISQEDLDIVRQVTSGQEEAAKLDTILQKYGLIDAISWSK